MISKKSNKMKFKKLLLMLPTAILAGTGVANLVACSCGDKPEVASYWNEDVEKAMGLKKENGKTNLIMNIKVNASGDVASLVPSIDNGSATLPKLDNQLNVSELFLKDDNSNKVAKNEAVAAFIKNTLNIAPEVKDQKETFDVAKLNNFKITDVTVEGVNYTAGNSSVLIIQPKGTKITFKFKDNVNRKETPTFTVTMNNEDITVKTNSFEDANVFKGENIDENQLESGSLSLGKFTSININAPLNRSINFKEGADIDKIFKNELKSLMKLLKVDKSDITAVITTVKAPTTRTSGASNNIAVNDLANIDIMLKGVKLVTITPQITA